MARPDGDGRNAFVDGGLWANNPVLVGLIEAMEIARDNQEIQIFCAGTCPSPAGEQIDPKKINRGLVEWKFGGKAAELSIAAQEFAYDNMAHKLLKHLNRPCKIVRFPSEQIPAALMPYLDLDDTRPAAMEALITQARIDADMTNSWCQSTKTFESELICQLFTDAPAIANTTTPLQTV